MEVTLRMYLIVCPLVFLGAVLDAVVGGGGLIALPAFLVAGLPPHMASATCKCSSVFGTTVSAARFLRHGWYHKKTILVSAVTALVGSALGTRLNLLLSERALHYVMVVLVPVMGVFLMFRRDFGTENRSQDLPENRLLALAAGLGLGVGLYDGFFGPGTGTFLILGFTALCRFDLVTASGNAKVVNLCSDIAAFVTFIFAGKVVWALGIPAALSCAAGHYVGSSLALKDGARIIRPMFLVVLTLLLVRVVYDLAAG